MTPRPSGEHMARVDCPRGHRQQVRVEVPLGRAGLWVSIQCRHCKRLHGNGLHVVFVLSSDSGNGREAKVS